MRVLEGLQPENVFAYFEEIAGIPRGSGNCRQISDWCVRFAAERNLFCIQDDACNIIIKKPGTPGYAHSAPVILQGHLDMVCEKEPDCTIDFAREGLRLCRSGDRITAQGTTLGGDDGIGIAYALAILEADDIPHPPLEAVFTTDEEIGMLGASALESSPLKGKTMLNLDSEQEGHLLVSCAGGVTASCIFPVASEEAQGVCYALALRGLTGGHSGMEIDKQCANAIALLGRLLDELHRRIAYDLLTVSGGTKDNAIPRASTAVLILDPEDVPALKAFAEEYEAILRKEYADTDPALAVTLRGFAQEEIGTAGADTHTGSGVDAAAGAKIMNTVRAARTGNNTYRVLTAGSKYRLVSALLNLPCGIQRMSTLVPDLVQTSLNPGILQVGAQQAVIRYCVRSSVESEKQALLSRMRNLTELLGGRLELAGDYPGMEYRRDSKLRELMIEVYEEQYGEKPVVEAVHAGVECGIFASKIPDLDCVSFGPELTGIHTTAEAMSVSSVQRVWEYLLEILKRLR